uniref:lysoplasmalogenase n=1 Tax=Plectus sambesii TaxID=2011161 RepID=A0A914WCL8_9BILA
MLTKLATVAYLATVAITCVKTDYFEEPDNRAWVAAPVTLLGLLLLVFDRNRPSDSRTVYGLGLITCGIADYVINHGHFITGAALFGVGHIFYIVSIIDQVKKWWSGLVLGSYAFAVVIDIICFHDKIVDQPIEISVLVTYSFILITVFIMAGSIWYHQDAKDLQSPSKIRFIGFALFILSDSVIILHRVSVTIPYALQIIFATYYAAQLFIFLGNYHSDLHTSAKKTL